MSKRASLHGLVRFLHQRVTKPILFLFPPESVHDGIVRLGRVLGVLRLQPVIKFCLAYRHSTLRQEVLGLTFPNPVGLAAGFDKNAALIDVLPAVGFGFVEVGSITAFPCAGNPKPRLWRLPRFGSIQVNYGLANQGVAEIKTRLLKSKLGGVVGTNIAHTNIKDISRARMIADYVASFTQLAEVGSYFTINISCPNIEQVNIFCEPAYLKQLLTALDLIPTKKPIFLKLSADLALNKLDQLVEVAKRHRVHGFVCTNLTKNKERLIECGAAGRPGGISGKPVADLSNAIIKHLYLNYGNQFVIIGCGGISSAADAYEKIRLGATLVQMVTGLIYEGPQVVGEINRGLVALLKSDNFKTLAEAVGSGV